MKRIVYIILVSFLLVQQVSVFAQSKTQYFQPAYSQRHSLNPAFATQWAYFSLPVLGKLDFSVRSNLGLSNFLFPLENGELGTFMHPDVSEETFFNTLSPENYMFGDVDLSLLSIGWFWGKSFWTIDVDLDIDFGLKMPYEFFELAKRGMYENNTEYDINDIRFNVDAMASVALGYSRQIDENWRVGGKLKFITSLGAVDINVDNMHVNMSDTKWQVAASGYANVMGSFFKFTEDTAGRINGMDFDPSQLRPAGYGAAIDFGFEYAFSKAHAVNGLRFSFAVTDLGFVYYKAAQINRAEATGNIEYTGFENISSAEDLKQQIDDLQDDLFDMLGFGNVNSGNVVSMLAANMNAGVEYAFFRDKFSVGLLSSTRFGLPKVLTELTVSANIRPVNWFSANVSYSFANTFNTIGASLNFTPLWGLNLFLSSDYIMLETNSQYIPIKNAHFNFQFGLTVPIGNNRPDNNAGYGKSSSQSNNDNIYTEPNPDADDSGI